jgi:hypothetical protein
VERTVPFVPGSFFAGETFTDLPDAQRRVVTWCQGRAGMGVHGTLQARPAEVFRIEEQPLLPPAPTEFYDLPLYAIVNVHRDHHLEVGKAFYSVPGDLIGQHVQVRADRSLVRVFARGQLVKVHPRQQVGKRSTDPDDLPAERTIYAMRDLDHLQRLAAGSGVAFGSYAAALLDHPLPWTKMRQVYALLGLVKKWGAARVETACASTLEHEAVNVALIGWMLERGINHIPGQPPSQAPAPRWWWRAGSPATLTSSRPAAPRVAPGERRAGEHQPGAQGAAAPGQARPIAGHPPRAARVGPHRLDGRPRRVPRARPGR